jgi:hypothetical protein
MGFVSEECCGQGRRERWASRAVAQGEKLKRNAKLTKELFKK